MTGLLTSPLSSNTNAAKRFQLSQVTDSQLSTSPVCRICFAQNDDVNTKLIRPCNCKGSVAYIHNRCLLQWVTTTNKKVCEICTYPYEMITDGLKPMKEWKWPHALDDSWEDELDFRCSIAWLMFMSIIFFSVVRNGLSDLPNVIGSVIGNSTIWYKLWWLTFFLNGLYYGSIVLLVYDQWMFENSRFKFKNRDEADVLTARTTSTHSINDEKRLHNRLE
ncbi:unnamed protein product, partial [Mesorhabditis belari]|uniref:RING-CH-type domain-containing protein n=1 Tax=Mesorhabditis belari TaxID=2138241 RepID=A0AAF3ENZ0_9BILA